MTELQDAYARHADRRTAIKFSKQLIKLVLELQKHRGCTLAILSGDHFFATQLHNIQREITELFRKLQKTPHGFTPAGDHAALLGEWIVLRQHWPKDDPHENFLHHSNLISQILLFIWQSCGELLAKDLDDAQQKLARFFLKDWLDMIEACAQARGLATHSAVVGSLSEEIASRIRYLNNTMQELDSGLQALLPQLLSRHQTMLQKRITGTEYSMHLNAFLQATQKGINKGNLQDADYLYRLGSQVVSSCQQVLWCALQLLDQCLPKDLMLWIEGKEPSGVVVQSKPSSTILPIAVPASSSR